MVGIKLPIHVESDCAVVRRALIGATIEAVIEMFLISFFISLFCIQTLVCFACVTLGFNLRTVRLLVYSSEETLCNTRIMTYEEERINFLQISRVM